MLNRILATALRNRLLILLLSLVVAGYGAYEGTRMPVDVLPDLDRPTVIVLAEAHAMVPEEIERLITYPLEQVLNGATDVIRIRSSSGMGLSMLFVEFDWGTDVYRNRQIVQEKLQLARAKLPPDVEPLMAPISSIMGQIQLIGLKSRGGATSADELRTLAEYQIKYRLLSLPGVAGVAVAGGAPRQLQVIADAGRLAAYDVALADLAQTIRQANLTVSGGFLELGHKTPLITLTGLLARAGDLALAVIRPDPVRPVLVKDVATVDFGPAAIRTGEAGIDGEPGIILAVSKQPETDTAALTERIGRELQEIQQGLPADVVILDDLFQQAAFIHRAVENVTEAILIGAVLVVLVLFVFLLNKRSALITLTAIPLSIAISVLVFRLFGLSINTMTLGGLAVAIGALVDDAIVDVENVHRRLRENGRRPRPLHPLQVVFQASSEVRRPILLGTALVVVVYLPLFYLTGLEGRLFTPIGVAYITSILASLLVSVTVTPVLCFYLLGRSEKVQRAGEAWVVRRLKEAVGRAIQASLARPVAVIALLLSLVMGAAFLLANRGTQFLPEFNEGVAQVNLFLPPETGLAASSEFGRRLGRELKAVDGVGHVALRTGRAEGDEHVHGVNFTHAIVTLEPGSRLTREEVVSRIREMLAREFPGVSTEVSQPLEHLLSHLLSGVKAQVAIKASGPDLAVLRGLAREVEQALRPIPGVVDLFTEPQVLVDHIEVRPLRERLAQRGLSVERLGELVELALEGETLSQMMLGQVSLPVVMRLAEKDRNSLETIGRLLLRAEDGARVPLSEVAEVRLALTPNNINRENVSRQVAVQHNVAGRSLGEVVADVQRALAPIKERLARMPGYAIRIGGQFEARETASRMITIFGGVALAIMFLLLYLHFRSVNLSLQVLMSVPMAFIGGVAFIVLTGQPVSVATLVGLIALGGIATRNAILLIDHYLHLMREEGEPFGPAMIIRAGQERMTPVVMTALTSGIALVPLALAPGQPGRELLYPVATVILGGLVSSTLLDFLVHPALFQVFGRRVGERAAAAGPAQDRDAAARALGLADAMDTLEGKE